MEALDHRDAWALVRTLADGSEPIREMDIRSIHALVVGRTDRDAAGRYAEQPRFVAGSRAAFPSPAELPALMGDFAGWLATAAPTPESAIEAHLRLVTIHPFADGNGRTARLLMNLLLVRGGYPPAAIDPAHRADYLDSLEAAQADGDRTSYDALMLARIDEALDAYLGLVEGRPPVRPS
jgi:Fic family protein